MNNIIKVLGQYIEKFGGKIVDTSDGYDGEFSEADLPNLPLSKYVLPYVCFSCNRDTFLKIGEKCIQFNKESKDNEKFIYWKVIVFESDKVNSEFCLSATSNRMDLHDQSVATGLTREKRTELLNTSTQLLIKFKEFLQNGN
ncbi:MAG: hypothetical protein IPG12_10655 [Saprospiraceae bacterium]|nr:hypothetical protein [Saprospiraceae bacterium]